MMSANRETAQEKKRIEFIDLAKGVCIFLVVYMHCCSVGEDSNLEISLTSLRMPLYFFLSGLFFSNYGSLVNHTIKKLNKIIIPFIFFLLISYLLSYITGLLSTGEAPYKLSDNLTLSRSWWTNPRWPNVALWFLICLFWNNLIFAAISLMHPSRLKESIYILSLTFVGIVLSYFHLRLPFYLSSSFISLPFFYAGHLLRKSNLLYGTITNKELVLALCFICAMLAFPYFSNSSIDFRRASIEGNIFVAFIIPMFSVLGILLVCKKFVRLPYFSYIGRYSIIILGLHWPIMEMCKTLVPDTGPYHNYFIFVIIMIITTLMIKPMTSLFPHFTAQKDLISIPKYSKRNIFGRVRNQ